MPELREQRTLEEVAETEASLRRFVLARGAEPLALAGPFEGVAIAIGPEGGLEAAELGLLMSRGWHPVAVGGNTLRFETAAMAAVAIIRGRQPE